VSRGGDNATVLVAGVPRSGTTWGATLLGATTDASYFEEPDNHFTYPFAFRAKRGLAGRFYPALEPAQEASDYERLWSAAFRLDETWRQAGRALPARMRRSLARAAWSSIGTQQIRGALLHPDRAGLALRVAQALAVPERPRPDSRHLIVKSVLCPLSLEWIATRFPLQVVVVLRDVRNVLSSWIQLEWVRYGIPAPARGASPVVRGTWLLGMLTLTLEDAARRHPDWHVVRHEELCRSPHAAFRQLAATIGLEWTVDTDDLLDELNRMGRGMQRVRVASELPEVWRSRLGPEQAREIAATLERFPLGA
jgi:hypothetical protein